MNVSKGDLAIVVAPYVIEGRGAFVFVIDIAPLGDCIPLGENLFSNYGNAWIVEGWVRGIDNKVRGPQLIIGDHCLRRIPKLDEDSEDEISIIKPHEVTA